MHYCPCSACPTNPHAKLLSKGTLSKHLCRDGHATDEQFESFLENGKNLRVRGNLPAHTLNLEQGLELEVGSDTPPPKRLREAQSDADCAGNAWDGASGGTYLEANEPFRVCSLVDTAQAKAGVQHSSSSPSTEVFRLEGTMEVAAIRKVELHKDEHAADKTVCKHAAAKDLEEAFDGADENFVLGGEEPDAANVRFEDDDPENGEPH